MKNSVRVERAIARLTQQELADRVGVSRQTINAMEAGKYIPSTVLSLKVSEVFGKTVNEIFNLEDQD